MWPAEGTLKQDTMFVHPHQIMDSLSSFWTPLWQRPTEEGVMDMMRPFLEGLTHFPPIEVDLSHPQLCFKQSKP